MATGAVNNPIRQRATGSSSLQAAARTCSSTYPPSSRRALSTLNEGRSIEYEIEGNRGKEPAVKLKVK